MSTAVHAGTHRRVHDVRIASVSCAATTSYPGIHFATAAPNETSSRSAKKGGVGGFCKLSDPPLSVVSREPTGVFGVMVKMAVEGTITTGG